MAARYLPLAMIASAAFAAVPVQFTAGSKASADEVNRNFAYVDSAKASKASVDLLTATVNGNTLATSALAGRHDSLVAASRKFVDTAKVADSVKALRIQLATKSDSSAIEARLSQPIFAKSSDWTKWTAFTSPADSTVRARINSDHNGISYSLNAWYNGAWQTDDATKKRFVYIQHMGNGRHEFRVWAPGASTWSYPLVISETGVVADSIYTRALAYKVSTPVADYVFEPSYPLAPLSEVDAYVRRNKHLPEVPSASEMESKGVDLAKMNMLLLKKVEELTLHAIEQEKRIQALERKAGN